MNIHENRVSSEQIRRRQSDSIVPSSTRLLHGSVDVVVVSAAEDPIFERNFFDSIEQEDQEYTPRYNHHVYRSFSALESSGKQNTMHDQSDDMCMFNLTLGNGSNDESLVNETNDSLDHGETIHMPQNLTEELNVETSDDCHKLDFEIESPKVTLDDFHMITLIGLGAYGKVYLVQERVSNEIYAMKVIKKHVVLQKNLMRHTHEERNVLTTVKHPFIVTLKYAFQTEHKLYLIMEYIQGGELFTRLNEENCFLEHVAVFYAAEIVLAFDHLHSMDVIYRDLKPENVLIGKDGHLCLTDFGLAKSEVSAGRARTFCGTLEYMAPEMIKNEDGYGKGADWWALGCLIYEMLTGRPPFKGANNREIQNKILNGKVSFPTYMTTSSKSIIKGLLSKHIPKRLGCGPKGVTQIKNHKFFANINWEKLLHKSSPAPFVPTIKDDNDYSRFDEKFTSQGALISPLDGIAPLSKSQQDRFKGFSFVRD